MKHHLKKPASPKSWQVGRKGKNKFISRPKAGAHALVFSLPLGVIIRDFLKYANTMEEAKKLLNNQRVLVDGRRRKDHRLPVGLFDILSFPDLKENFRLLLDRKGRVAIKKINPEESSLKPCRIVKRTALSKNLQLNLHDGRNILVDKNFPGKTGDTVLITLPEQKIKETLELTKEAFVFLVKGKRAGEAGLLQETRGELALYQKDNQTITTLKKYLFVLGHKKPVIDIKIE